MENKQEENKKIDDDMKFMTMSIGKDMPKLEPEKVKIIDMAPEEVKDKDGKMIGTKLNLVVQHSKVDKLNINKVRYEQDKKVKVSGLWLNKDQDGKLPSKSALAHLLRYYKKNAIDELTNLEIETTTDDNNYLIAKAY